MLWLLPNTSRLFTFLFAYLHSAMPKCLTL